MPRVSIGLPVFNGEEYLSTALQSLLAQTYGDFELIISDNASTDRTYDICHEYMQVDKRIKYYRNETNLGGAFNDNHVFSLSTGEYFKWAADDDICAPEFIEKCVETLELDSSIVLCYPKTIIINETGQFVEYYKDNFNLLSSKPHERLQQVIGWKDLLNPVYGIIRSEALGRTQLIKAYIASDRVLLGELALQGKFYEFPEYLFYRRIHPKKSTVANKTIEQQTNWYDPKATGKIAIPKTRRFMEFFLSIHRSHISLQDKIHCYNMFFTFYFSPKTFSGRFKGLMEDINQAAHIISNNLIHHGNPKN